MTKNSFQRILIAFSNELWLLGMSDSKGNHNNCGQLASQYAYLCESYIYIFIDCAFAKRNESDLNIYS